MSYRGAKRVVGPAVVAESLPRILVVRSSERREHDSSGVYAAIDAQDGEVLAGHFSSNDQFGWGDLGGTLSRDWHHEAYLAKYPNGFVLEWCERGSEEHREIERLNRLFVEQQERGDLKS